MSSISTKKYVIIFCIPGNNFSRNFMNSWTNTIFALCRSNKYDVIVSNQFSSQVNFARAMCLGANVLGGVSQKPFQGKIKYDAVIWLDSDMVFSPEQIFTLIEKTLHEHKVFSGIYFMNGGSNLCCVENWDLSYYKKYGSFEFLTKEKFGQYIKDDKRYLKCAYVGMGCMGIRYGILEDERLKYPWFFRNIEKIDDNIYEGISEDVSFIKNLIDSGIIDNVVVDLKLKFGHEKSIIY